MKLEDISKKAQVASAGWWSLPEDVQQTVLDQMPKQNEWSFLARRVNNFAWAFDLPVAMTYGEKLVGGTNDALDEHFKAINGREAKDGDGLDITCSIEPLEGFTTELTKVRDDENWEGSAFYLDSVTGREIWLCPFTSVLYSDAPQKMYIRFGKI